MTKQLMILATAMTVYLAVGSIPALAETFRVKVVGVTTDKSKGDRNPARRHEDCANEFVNGRWCSTRDYLDGGMAIPADVELATSWIRPEFSPVYTPNLGLVYIDVSGDASSPRDINCNQWSSKDDSLRGTVLQRQKGSERQLVSTRQCSETLRSLCCAAVEDDL